MSTTMKGTRLTFPDSWHSANADEFDQVLDAAGSALDEQFAQMLRADLKPILDSAVGDGLVMFAGLFESLDPEPVELDIESLTVPFAADDIKPTAIAATLAVIEQPRPNNDIAAFSRVLEARTPRAIAAPEVVELPAGPTVIVREVQTVHPEALKHSIDVYVATYYVFPADAPEVLLMLLFRTPTLNFVPEFDEHFAAIANTAAIVDVEH